MITDAIKKVVERENLSVKEAQDVMEEIMLGQATAAQIASYITAMRMKGETVEEIASSAQVMRSHALVLKLQSSSCVDTCGTGGDHSGTFNISTAAALVAAGAGAKVAKHGNRSVSSRCGSADVLSGLGVNLDISPEKVARCVDEIGIGFLFAPQFHTAMKHAMVPRKDIGIRTMFNLLGPLTNPAGAQRQVLGVFHRDLVRTFTDVLHRMGREHVLVVHGSDGLDELTLTGPSFVGECQKGVHRYYEILPEEYGLSRCSSVDLLGGEVAKNVGMIQNILHGQKGAARDVVVLNAGAVLYVAGCVPSILEGVQCAQTAIDSGNAVDILSRLVRFTNE